MDVVICSFATGVGDEEPGGVGVGVGVVVVVGGVVAGGVGAVVLAGLAVLPVEAAAEVDWARSPVTPQAERPNANVKRRTRINKCGTDFNRPPKVT